MIRTFPKLLLLPQNNNPFPRMYRERRFRSNFPFVEGFAGLRERLKDNSTFYKISKHALQVAYASQASRVLSMAHTSVSGVTRSSMNFLHFRISNFMRISANQMSLLCVEKNYVVVLIHSRENFYFSSSFFQGRIT